QWRGSRPRLLAIPCLSGRSRARKPPGRPGARPPDCRDHQRRVRSPGTARQVSQRYRPVSLHRISQPDRAQDLGQLAVPPGLHRPADTGMVAAQAAWVGVIAAYAYARREAREITMKWPDW